MHYGLHIGAKMFVFRNENPGIKREPFCNENAGNRIFAEIPKGIRFAMSVGLKFGRKISIKKLD
jgi:hypothetical protein